MKSLAMRTDSYKVSHYKQYRPKTNLIYSYWESRGGIFPEIPFFGLRYYLERYLSKPITLADIDYAEHRWSKHLGPGLFNRAGWEAILKHAGGFLPLAIHAVPEGMIVSPGNVMLTIENTMPEAYWLTNWAETLLSKLWYPCTVAAQSREIKRDVLGFLNETGDPGLIGFKLHDFGYRGASSEETAEIGGAAHLINFLGTDTSAGFELAYEHYEESMAGFSIPAAEHSTITSWGRENEVEAFRNMIQQFGSGALYAVVSDSFDLDNAVQNLWGNQLKAEVLAANGTLVVRPDSGVPHEIVLRTLEGLGKSFGAETNSKGYKVLHPKVRVIQGDGVNALEIHKILQTMKDNGWSADNIAFGMGGALLQKLDRDTCKFAFKCSYTEVDGEGLEVYKAPVTDPGKNSKRGRLKLCRQAGGKLVTLRENEWGPSEDLLELAYIDGMIMSMPTFSEIRERAAL